LANGPPATQNATPQKALWKFSESVISKAFVDDNRKMHGEFILDS